MLMNQLSMLRRTYHRFQRQSRFPKPGLPTVIQFPINDICNSRCQMCNIWQQKTDHEITPDEVRSVLMDPLYREVTGVGLNGGEPTLRRDIAEIVLAIVQSLPKLRGLYLITNAIRFEQVTRAIEHVGQVCNANEVELDVMVSLDGIGAVHDRVRGRAGNFESAVRVIDFVEASKSVQSFRIGCTIIKENVYDCENILDWCEGRNCYARFRVGIPHQRLYSTGFPHPQMLDDDEKFHLANFLDNLRLNYERDRSRQEFYLSLRNQLVYGLPRASGCPWKSHGVTLSSRGELSYCAVASPTLGNAITESSAGLYWGNAEKLKVIQKEECDRCYHDYDAIMMPEPPTRRFVKHVGRAFIRKVGKAALPQGLQETLQRRHSKNLLRRSRPNESDTRMRRLVSRPCHCDDLPNRILLCGWYGTETFG